MLLWNVIKTRNSGLEQRVPPHRGSVLGMPHSGGGGGSKWGMLCRLKEPLVCMETGKGRMLGCRSAPGRMPGWKDMFHIKGSGVDSGIEGSMLKPSRGKTVVGRDTPFGLATLFALAVEQLCQPQCSIEERDAGAEGHALH